MGAEAVIDFGITTQQEAAQRATPLYVGLLRPCSLPAPRTGARHRAGLLRAKGSIENDQTPDTKLGEPIDQQQRRPAAPRFLHLLLTPQIDSGQTRLGIRFTRARLGPSARYFTGCGFVESMPDASGRIPCRCCTPATWHTGC
jgi:hypothetical protein